MERYNLFKENKSVPFYSCPLLFGYKKLGDLIRASELFDVEIRNGSAMFIKDVRN